MDNLWQKVNEPDINLVECGWKECDSRGDYLRCYVDIFKLCPKYLTHKHYLNTVREMRKKHEDKNKR